MSFIKKERLDLKIERLIQNGQINTWLHLRETKFCAVFAEKHCLYLRNNIRRHFEAKHPNLAKLDVSDRQIRVSTLLKKLSGEQSFFRKINADNKADTKVRFQIAREIAAAGKSFTEGEFMKKCLLIAASELCPDKKSVFENISLSRMTVQPSVTDISNNLSNQLREKAEEFKY
jgi:hypothetical protein